MHAELIGTQEELPGVVTYFFQPAGHYLWQPGDYLELSFDYPNGGGGSRWFSIASAPHERVVQITMKYPPQPSEFKQQLAKLPVGGVVLLSPAMGNFNLPLQPAPLLFVAAGVGITAYRAMLLDLRRRQEKWDLQLLYTAKSRDRLFLDVIAASPATLIAHDALSSRLDLRTIEELVVDARRRIVYFAGPQPLIESIYNEALGNGYSRHQLKLDYFPGYTDL